MKLALVAAGRLKSGPLRDLFEDYSRRLAWPLAVTEIEERRPLAAADMVDQQPGNAEQSGK